MGKAVAVPESHRVPTLLASMDQTSEMEPIAAALRTKDADDLTWDYVSTTLIDEYNANRKTTTRSGKRLKRKRNRRAPARHTNRTPEDNESSSDDSTNFDKAT